MAEAETQEEGRLARLRARYPWLDHLVRAGVRYDGAKGDFTRRASPTSPFSRCFQCSCWDLPLPEPYWPTVRV